MKINRATLKDLPDILHLLKECELPVQGVIDHLRNFLVLKVEGKMIGCVGLEIYKNFCLLRSLAVIGIEQGKGYGHILVDEILRLIKKKNINKVYLLTTDGVDYFKRFNFRAINRNKVDSEIQKTLAFNSQCCSSAICMSSTIN